MSQLASSRRFCEAECASAWPRFLLVLSLPCWVQARRPQTSEATLKVLFVGFNLFMHTCTDPDMHAHMHARAHHHPGIPVPAFMVLLVMWEFQSLLSAFVNVDDSGDSQFGFCAT